MRNTERSSGSGNSRTVQVRSADELFDKMWGELNGPKKSGVARLSFKYIGSEADHENFRAAKRLIAQNVVGAKGCSDKRKALGFLNKTYRDFKNEVEGVSALDQLNLRQRAKLIGGQVTNLESVSQVRQVRDMLSRGHLEVSGTKLRASRDSVKVAIVDQLAALPLSEGEQVRVTMQIRNPAAVTSDRSYSQRFFGWLGKAVDSLVSTARSIDIRFPANTHPSEKLSSRLNGLGQRKVEDFIQGRPALRESYTEARYSPFRIFRARIDK